MILKFKRFGYASNNFLYTENPRLALCWEGIARVFPEISSSDEQFTLDVSEEEKLGYKKLDIYLDPDGDMFINEEVLLVRTKETILDMFELEDNRLTLWATVL